jgi:Tol biopolymer transport system component
MRKLALLGSLVLALIAASALVARAAVTDTALVSRASGPGGAAGQGDSGPGTAVSATGRFVAFESSAVLSDAAVPGVTNVYLRDTESGAASLISRATGVDGAGADNDSAAPTISPAGRYVAFESLADNLATDDNDAVRNIFVRDTFTNKTKLVSRASDGAPADGDSFHPSISVNGWFIAFESVADNLSADDDDQFSNIFMRDTTAGTTDLVNRVSAPTNAAADGDSYGPTIDRDGKRVAFTSDADNLSTKDDNAYTNVFVRDLPLRFTSAVSLPTGGFLSSTPADGDSFDAAISWDGRYVAFLSYASNFVDEPIRTPTVADVFRRDIQASKTILVSRATGADGQPAFANSSHPSISVDGRFVAFASDAGNLSTEDGPSSDVFVRDLSYDTTTLASRASGVAGAAGDGASSTPALSIDGRFVAFASDADNLSDQDGDAFRDVFTRELLIAAPVTEVPPDLGNNDHSQHNPADPSHTEHTPSGHEGHISLPGDTSGPSQTLFAPPTQDIDTLFVLAQVHEAGTLVVTATVALPRGGRSSKLYRFKSFTRTVPAHEVFRVRLKLAKKVLRNAKRALKRGKRLNAKVTAKARDLKGNWTTARKTIRLRD